MSAMYRLKAYFGMVPADEMGEYAEETVADRYGPPRRPSRSYDEDRWDEDDEPAEAPEPVRSGRYTDDDWDRDRRPARTPAAAERTREAPTRVASVVAKSGSGSSSSVSSTHGALAMDTDPVREPVRPSIAAVSAVPEQRERIVGASALSRITTLQPRSYNEARTIGERYRDGVPVIMNLTELDDAAAKRLVDFAAGLAFALRGSIDKVTSRVFLLTPADVEVSADDARKLAERGIFRQD